MVVSVGKAGPFFRHVCLVAQGFNVRCKVVFLRGATINFMLILVRMRWFANLVRVLVINYGGGRTLFRPSTLCLMVMDVSSLCTQVIRFARAIFKQLSIFRFFGILFRPFCVRRVTFNAFLGNDIRRLLYHLRLVRLAPGTVKRRYAIQGTSDIQSIRRDKDFRRLRRFLPPTIQRVREEQRAPLVLCLRIVLLCPIFRNVGRFRGEMVSFGNDRLLFPPSMFLVNSLRLLIRRQFHFVHEKGRPIGFSRVLGTSRRATGRRAIPRNLRSLSLNERFVKDNGRPFREGASKGLSIAMCFFVSGNRRYVLGNQSNFPCLIRRDGNNEERVAVSGALVHVFIFRFKGKSEARCFIQHARS